MVVFLCVIMNSNFYDIARLLMKIVFVDHDNYMLRSEFCGELMVIMSSNFYDIARLLMKIVFVDHDNYMLRSEFCGELMVMRIHNREK